MATFQRNKQIKQLINSIGDKKIKVITGIRRSGKTYLLTNIFPKQLKASNIIKSESDVLIISLKGKDNNITSKTKLLHYLNEKPNRDKKFIVIDEVQQIKNFDEILLQYKNSHEDKEIFITGSNSKIMSKEILRKFQESGLEIHLRPLAFKEIREELPDYSVDDYLKYGGLPLIVNEKEEKREEELKRIYDELYISDINDKLKDFRYITTTKISDIIRTIFSTTNEISTKEIAKRFLKGIDYRIEEKQDLIKEIEDAIQLLVDSYLIEEFENDSFNTHNILENIGLNKKYYCVDNGLLYINCEDGKRKDGTVLENAIYLYLKYKGINPKGKILLGTENNKEGEVDFNYHKDELDYHIQVTYEYHDGDYEREVGNLLRFNDDSQKILVYKKDTSTISKEPTIKYIDCETYLLNN